MRKKAYGLANALFLTREFLLSTIHFGAHTQYAMVVECQLTMKTKNLTIMSRELAAQIVLIKQLPIKKNVLP